MKFVPMDPINNIQALFQIMAWHQSGDKPLSEPVMFFIYGPIYHSASLGLTVLNKLGRKTIDFYKSTQWWL